MTSKIIVLTALLVLGLPVLTCTRVNVESEQSNPAEVRGWNKARWGMSEQEVLDAFAGTAARLQKSEEGVGERATIEIKAFPVLTETFEVRFFFDSRKHTLEGVTLRSRQPVVFPADICFCRFEQALTFKYGTPVYRGDVNLLNDIPSSLHRWATWKLKDTAIELHYEFMKYVTSELTIGYRPTQWVEDIYKGL
jgi:hypothetical protein